MDDVKGNKSKALCMFPLKALANDQLVKMTRIVQSAQEMLYEITEEMKTTDPDKTTFTSKEKAAFVSTSHPDVDVVRLERLADAKMAVCDGDTDAEVKAKIKKQRTQILLTNPDSLHHAMLPAHKSWGKNFWGSLRYVVLDEADRALIKGFLINKFRGDTTLFAEGMTIIERATGWQGVGILPWFPQARFLPAEDILDIRGKSGDARDGAPVRIAVPVLRRIANFDDLDPLAGETDVDVTLVEAGDVIPADADLILLPGSKSTISDLTFLRDQGWDIDIAAHLRRGGMVMGLCGGYQMLGTRLDDPDGVEGPAGDTPGLGHLGVETVLAGDKRLTQVTAHANAFDVPVRGYEIHMGRTGGPDCDRPFLTLDGRPEGAVSADGAVIGTYLHGIFADDGFRRAFLDNLAARRGREGAFGEVDFDARVDATLDELAAHMAANLDLDAFARIAGL